LGICHQHGRFRVTKSVKTRTAMQRLVDISDKVNQKPESLCPTEFSGHGFARLQNRDASLDGVDDVILALDKAFRLGKRTGPKR
jgi:hypothetical protein